MACHSVSLAVVLFCFFVSFAISFVLLMNSCADFVTVCVRLRGMQNVPTKLCEEVACRSKKQHPFDLEILIPTRHKPCETGNKVWI